jgi:hypothetical protein
MARKQLHQHACQTANWLFWIGVGLFATFSMDLAGIILSHFGIPAPNYHPIGKFLLAQAGISGTPTWQNLLGWAMHIGVGMVDAGLYMLFTFKLLKTRPHFLISLVFAWAMMVMPMLIEQPALGMGIAGNLTAHPMFTRFATFTYHTIFGLGLYSGSRVFYALSRICHLNQSPFGIEDDTPAPKPTEAPKKAA